MDPTDKLRPAPYGAWKSPIGADLVTGATLGLSACALDGEDVFWIEERADGRAVLVRRDAKGATEDVTSPEMSIRSRVHEYGGGAFRVDGGEVFFCNKKDQRVYRSAARAGAAPAPMTPEDSLRYADFSVDRARKRLVAVREDHRKGGEPANTIVAIPFEKISDGKILVEGHDFYAAPRLSPDGRFLAWIAWRHPDMPWDSTELFVAPVEADGTLGERRRVAGGGGESIVQPAWSPDGTLHFVSDRNGGWWNLFRVRGNSVEPVLPLSAEFGKPLWKLDQATYGWISDGRIVAIQGSRGRATLTVIDTRASRLEPLPVPGWDDVREVRVSGSRVLFLGASAVTPRSVVLHTIGGATTVLRRSTETVIDPAFLSVPEAIDFPTANDRSAHALWYPPRNAKHIGPPGERPPLIVQSHGGPTSQTSPAFNLEIQYFTSRGIGVVDVDYGGSTGYGREYRKRLNGNWGIVDVDDCVNAAQFLVKRGDVDPKRLCIEGSSASGYTTLCALAFRRVFAAGVSYYGVSDLKALATDTHKFESRYLDSLVGPYPARADLYKERAPLEHPDRITVPVLFLQGLEDKVVPPDQSSRMADALRTRGIPVAYLTFEGEGHGFDRADSNLRALEAHYYFYGKILGFTPADTLPPITIDNLPKLPK